MIILSGSSNPALAGEVAYEAGSPLGAIRVGRFADGEVEVSIGCSVRGKDVYVLQSTCAPVNDSLLELCIIVGALRRASARTVTAVIPYLGYKRDVGTTSALIHLAHHGIRGADGSAADSGDVGEGSVVSHIGEDAAAGARADEESAGAAAPVDRNARDAAAAAASAVDDAAPALPDVPVSAADVAKMLEASGVDRVIAIDPQLPGQGLIEGFFSPRTPVESLRSTSLGVEHVARLKLRKPVVVAPNASCLQLAQDFRIGLERRLGADVGLAAIVEAGDSATRYEAHTVGRKATATKARAGEGMTLVGSVQGADCVLVDDLVDTAKTLVSRAHALREAGAARVICFAAHGLFNGRALARIARSPLTDVVTTNTVPLREDSWAVAHNHKIAQISVAPLLAAAILRVQTQQSLQDLRVVERGTASPRYQGQE